MLSCIRLRCQECKSAAMPTAAREVPATPSITVDARTPPPSPPPLPACHTLPSQLHQCAAGADPDQGELRGARVDHRDQGHFQVGRAVRARGVLGSVALAAHRHDRIAVSRRRHHALLLGHPPACRRYPNRYESIIGTLCDSLESLDEPEAKASMIWIIGEYAERIDNAGEAGVPGAGRSSGGWPEPDWRVCLAFHCRWADAAGFAFLTLSSPPAPPPYALHRRAAGAVPGVLPRGDCPGAAAADDCHREALPQETGGEAAAAHPAGADVRHAGGLLAPAECCRAAGLHCLRPSAESCRFAALEARASSAAGICACDPADTLGAMWWSSGPAGDGQPRPA